MKSKTLVTSFLLCAIFYSENVLAFSCRTVDGDITNIGGGTARVVLPLKPQLGENENIIIDLSEHVRCYNDSEAWYTDIIKLAPGTQFVGALGLFRGVVSLVSDFFPLPINNNAGYFATKSTEDLPISLYITPVEGAYGVLIKEGMHFATVRIRQTNDQNSDLYYFTWNLVAKNSVAVPVGGCDINSRDIIVSMGDYPSDVSEKNIDISLRCAKEKSLSFSLSGSTELQTVFSNVSTSSSASGIGIEILKDGQPVPANTRISIGMVGSTYQSLGLKARYALNGEPLKAGNVRAVIGVNVTYN